MAKKSLFILFNHFLGVLEYCLSRLAPGVLLAIRLLVGRDFLMSGLAKLQSWDSTLYLFSHEFVVPALSPEFAAMLGVTAEISLPVLFALGFLVRPVAFAFFIFNVVTVCSYPYLWTADGAIGFHQHVLWGLLIAVIMTHGAGCFSVDALLKKFCNKKK